MSNKRMKVSDTSGSEIPSVTLKDLPNDVLKHCFSFVPGSYITVAPVSRQFHRNYCTQGMDDSLTTLSTDVLLKIGRNKRTTVESVANDIKLTEYYFINNAPEKFMIKVCKMAALKSRIDVIECAIAFGVDFIQFVRREVRWYGSLMKTLAEEGNLEMIQYFDSKLPEGFDEHGGSDEFIWTNMFYLASLSNHLHIMKWICEEKIQDTDNRRAGMNRTDMKSRIEAHEHVLEGMIASRVTEELCKKAVECGNIETLEYCHQNNYQFDRHYSQLCNYSMENKDKEQALVTLKWLRQHGSPWNEYLCKAAASNDNLEALKWARSENCPWDQWTLCDAAKNGNIPMIEYCLQNECPMTAQVCTSAMHSRDHDTALEVLKLLRKHSCPWDFRTFSQAICSGNFEAMFWAKQNGCPWTAHNFASITKNGNASIIEQFLQSEPIPGSLFVHTEGTVKMTAEVVELINKYIFLGSNDSRIIEIFKLLRKYGYEWNTQTAARAAKYNRLLVLKWLHFMNCPMDEDTCTAAVISGNIETLKYAHEVAGCGLSEAAYANCFHIISGLDATYTEIQEYLKKNDCPIPDEDEFGYYQMTDLREF